MMKKKKNSRSANSNQKVSQLGKKHISKRFYDDIQFLAVARSLDIYHSTRLQHCLEQQIHQPNKQKTKGGTIWQR